MDVGELNLFLRALGNPNRLKILDRLKKGKSYSVQEIAEYIGISIEATSQHLQQMYSVKILERRKRGIFVFYRLTTNLHPIVRSVLKFV